MLLLDNNLRRRTRLCNVHNYVMEKIEVQARYLSVLLSLSVVQVKYNVAAWKMLLTTSDGRLAAQNATS